MTPDETTPSCPHPTKRSWSSKAEAKKGAKRTKWLRPYLCRCGSWHLAHKHRRVKRVRGQLTKQRGN